MSVAGDSAVRKAAEYLDKYAAGGSISWLNADWRSKVDLGSLAMESVVRCVLGQLQGGSFDRAVDDLRKSDSIEEWGKVESAFCKYENEWIAYLEATKDGIDTSATWVSVSGDQPLRDLKIVELEGEKYVAFVRGGADIHSLDNFKATHRTLPPCPFVGGDVLIDQNGDMYLFVSKESVIRTKDFVYQPYRGWVRDSRAFGARVFKKDTYRSNDFSSRMWDGVTFVK